MKLRRIGGVRRVRAVAAVAAALAVAACCFVASTASAQSGSGAERYEVTITPPKRPGSETAPAIPADGDTGDAPAAEGAAPAADALAAPASAPPGDAEAKESLVPAAAATARPAANLPLRTLQVGAYRHRGAAKTLQGKLAADFPDVTVIEVKSGGEPLYRVNVGRLPKGKALDELRGRLAAAGHASFDVEAPPASAAN